MTIIICYKTCWSCKFGFCNPEPHPWWDMDDVEHAESMGYDPPEGDCACPCLEYLGEENAAVRDHGYESVSGDEAGGIYSGD